MCEERCHRAADSVRVGACGLCAGKRCCLGGRNGEEGWARAASWPCSAPQHPRHERGGAARELPGQPQHRGSSMPSAFSHPTVSRPPCSPLQTLWQGFTPCSNVSHHHPIAHPVHPGTSLGCGVWGWEQQATHMGHPWGVWRAYSCM